MASRQRLMVCLDGTWNQQDSSTNVLHHFNVVREGLDPKTNAFQKKYYHRGVGTGVLDSVTGGGLGFGLEQNVRDAYNWLIENYCDGEADRPPDEIYIFGFSRGAYTARSLVGFIGQCGLLRRGAPITVHQLWREYCILGREKEERRSAWDNVFWKSEARIRQITELTADPWSRGRAPAADLNESERLLVRWSRRVRITYLGLYDTVGAIGWDALAVPGLTSRMALHNNMRPTTIIQNCRHALALDEHRSSFNHTPFLAFVGHDASEVERSGEDAGSPEEAGAARRRWDQTRAMWHRKIEQRWFVGAHSNVGGGYDDNCMAQRPFHWIREGAEELGLATEPVAAEAPVTQADQMPCDSFAQFAAPLWTKVIRAKRNYRAVDPEPVPQASSKKSKDGTALAGFSLQTIHEEIDDTVAEYWRGSRVPLPPNLHEYVKRSGKAVACSEPAHTWLDEKIGDYVAVVMWATVAATGLCAVDRVTGLIAPSAVLLVACIVAFLLPLADWGESKINFECALGRRGPRARAFLDAVYWVRMLGFVLFVCGAVHSIVILMPLGWRHDFGNVQDHVLPYWRVPVCAAAAALIAAKFRSRAAWATLIAGPLTAAASAGILFGVAWAASVLFPELSRTAVKREWTEPVRSVPGLLLLLQLGLVYFWRAMLWHAEPLAKANLGSSVPLQRCLTPDKVTACLERWRSQLECRWLNEDPVTGPAAARMRELLGQTLWRDITGFIPVYSAVLLLGLWFASSQLTEFAWLNWPGGGLALWWMLPALGAGVDYIEDACHLRFRKQHEARQSPSQVLTMFSWSMSRIKDLTVVAALLLTLAAVLGGTWEISGNLADWRAKIALLITAAGLAIVLSGVVIRVAHMFRVRRTPLGRQRQAAAAKA